MSRWFWTAVDLSQEELEIEDGGYYEALDRKNGTAKPKSLNGVGAKSSVPELCVSKTPEASLFAKIQGYDSAGRYNIYVTEQEPDVEIDSMALDFEVLEECRFDLSGENSVKLSHYKTVQVPRSAVEDIRNAYKWSEPNSVNRIFAENIKDGLRRLVSGGSYPQNLSEEERSRLEEEYSDYY